MSAVQQPSEIGPLFAEDPAAPQHFTVMLYGPPGSGKSTAAATAPGPLLWINAEGANALAYARKTARQRGTQIHEVRLERGVDPRDQLRDALRHVKRGREPQCQTVVVDTLGKVRELLAAAMVQDGAKNSIRQWGDVAKVIKELVGTLRDAPVNAVFLCHESVDDVDDDRIVQPLIGGTLTALVPGEVDVMAYCGAVRTENGVRYVGQLVEARGRRAKDRSGGLGASRDLDLADWLSAFQRALGGGEDDVPFGDGYVEPEGSDAVA